MRFRRAMRVPPFLGLLCGAWVLAGCTSFDLSDDGNSHTILLGKDFSLSLPSVAEERALQISTGNVVRFVELKRNTPAGQDTFVFKAIGVGETEIHIPKGLNGSEAPDFVMTLKVVLGGSPY